MRILLVLRYFYCPSQPIGGAERQALRLSKELQGQGLSVTVVTGLWEWGQSRRQAIEGVPVHRHFTAWGMFEIKGLRKFAQYFYLFSLLLYLIQHRHEYDIIHCHSAMFGAPIVILAGQLLHKPAVIRAMASGAWGDLKMVRQDHSIKGTGWMLRKIREADAIVALNPEVAGEMIAIGVPADHIFLIPNGIQGEPMTQNRDYELGDTVIVTFVGRLHPQKDVQTLLEAFQLVVQQASHLQWQLRLAGTGPLEGKLKALVRDLSVERQVAFLGHVQDINALLDQSDLFVLPSLSEGISNALLEAMSRGLPCIVTDIPGNRDVIQDRVNGLLIQVGDSAGLARTIIDVVQDAALRKELGYRACQTIEAKYSLTEVANRYAGLYEDLLSQSLNSSGIRG